MALNPPSPFRVRPLPVVAASVVAAMGFVVLVAVVARLTADSAVIVGPVVDGGGAGAGPTDAGLPLDGGTPTVDGGAEVDADAGVLVTVEPGEDAGPEPDAGPPGAELPPYDPALVIAAAAPVVERCAQDALRWDPSLGGPFTLRVVLPASDDGGAVDSPAPSLAVAGLSSPILESCLQRLGPLMPRTPGTIGLTASQVVQARGVLRADGSVETADPVIMALPTTTAPTIGAPADRGIVAP